MSGLFLSALSEGLGNALRRVGYRPVMQAARCAGFARLAIGLTLTNGWALEQLWLFWIAPFAGAIIAGLVFRWFAQGAAGPAGRLKRLQNRYPGRDSRRFRSSCQRGSLDCAFSALEG